MLTLFQNQKEMFFVGLAGSIIPYILLMGVMLVFTFGANAEVMKKLSSDKAEANVLKVEMNAAATTNTDPVNFHFSAYNSFEKFAKEKTDNQSALILECSPVKPEITAFEVFSEIQPHYRSNFCTRYFGLSPPFMV